MANKIILKKSSVTGRVPSPETLEFGELALNYTDGTIYYKNSSGEVLEIGGNAKVTDPSFGSSVAVPRSLQFFMGSL